MAQGHEADEPSQPQAKQEQPQQEQPDGGIADIIVTAQRRAESSQKVPISITAFTAETLKSSGVVSLPQIAQLTPGLQFQAVGSFSVPFLRGVGATTTIVGAEAATALYVDGVYVSTQSLGYMSLPNIASVEVTKGPQGTVFGRNATAGVLQIRTRRPSHDTHVELQAGYGNFDTWDGSLYATTGLGTDAAIDLTLYGTKQGKGWGTNLFNGEGVFKRSDYIARSRLLLTPGNNTEINISGDYEEIRGEVGFSTRLPRPGELGQTERSLIFGRQFTGGFYDVDLDYPSRTKTKTVGLSLDWLQHLGGADFRSISAYRKTTIGQTVDFDLTSELGAHVSLPVSDMTFSQEFQLLSSENSDSRLKWIIGAYYYYQKGSYPGFQQFGTLLTLPPVPIATTPTQPVFLDSTQKTNSYSGFGQATYALTDNTNLTAGIRYTSDRRCLDATQFNPLFSNPPFVPRHQEGCKTFPKVTWKATLDHHFTEDVMAYAQYSRGFKSGFFNSQTLQSPPTDPTLTVPLPVQPETLDAYELGIKSDLLGRHLRVNLSAFYYSYRDMQVNAFVSATSRITINAASARIKGVEAEINAIPLKGLSLLVAASYLDAKYIDFPGAPAFTPRTAFPWGLAASQFNAKGKRLPNAPEFTGTFSATYRTPLAGGEIALNGTLYYNSGYFFEPENRLEQGAHALLSSSLMWTSPGERYSISLWGNNLTNRKILAAANPTVGGDSLTPRSPRTYGIRLGVKF